ncbi:hypothetical protein RRG08_062332 [Elysia crispata]|uniref:Uncharacterized protein n=1 Tax=Elysia crispata TaxID=231223 RepID=A0AAE0YG60_9GAST|nr:hypothetical protein RRG08_062332 [Elysia crispata]
MRKDNHEVWDEKHDNGTWDEEPQFQKLTGLGVNEISPMLLTAGSLQILSKLHPSLGALPGFDLWRSQFTPLAREA